MIKLLLIDRIFREPVEQEINTEEVAKEFEVNLNTAKRVFKELKELGYIETRKRAGTRINPNISEDKKVLYGKFSIKFQDIVEMALESGISPLETFACLTGAFISSLSSQGRGKIIFVEKNYYNLWTGKEELEKVLRVHVIPMLLEDAIRFFKKGNIGENLIVTTYYCHPILEREGITGVIPLRITPPLEELLNFSSLPKNIHILVVVISNSIKKQMNRQYLHLQQEFKNMRILTIQDILKDISILENVDILLILRLLYEEYRHIFRKVKKVMIYSRFYDSEGIEFIKKYLSKEKGEL